MRITRRKVVGFFIISVVALVLLVTFSNIVIITSTKAAIHHQVEGFPEDLTREDIAKAMNIISVVSDAIIELY